MARRTLLDLATVLAPARLERAVERAPAARLTVLGYRVVRFTYRRIVRHPAAVAATLRALLG